MFPRMTRILIADDHGVVRHGLKHLISEAAGMRVTGEASSGEEAFAMARSNRFDIAILDISMPGLGGLETLRRLQAEIPDLKIIILSMHPEEQYAIRCLKEGARAYLTKAGAPTELVNGIRIVAEGKRYITPSIADALASSLTPASRLPPHEQLSQREFEVLSRLGRGEDTRTIAESLHLSAKTVGTYSARVRSKLGLRSAADLIRYAYRHGLAE